MNLTLWMATSGIAVQLGVLALTIVLGRRTARSLRRHLKTLRECAATIRARARHLEREEQKLQQIGFILGKVKNDMGLDEIVNVQGTITGPAAPEDDGPTRH